MAKKRVFVDTNVIFECFRLGLWTELTNRYQVETVEECERETLRGNSNKPGYIPVNQQQLQSGCHAIHQVTDEDVLLLDLEYPEMATLDQGEHHLFAYLYSKRVQLSDITVLCTADKGAIRRAHDHKGWLDWIQSLEEALKNGKIGKGKIQSLREQHTAVFLSKFKTDILTGKVR